MRLGFEDKETIKRTYGVTVEVDDKTKEVLPKEVRLYTVKDMNVEVDLSEESSYYRPVGGNSGFAFEPEFRPEAFAPGNVAFVFDSMLEDCTVCDSRGRLPCEHCEEHGGAPCARCRGIGLTREEVKEMFVGTIDCGICQGKGARPRYGPTHMSQWQPFDNDRWYGIRTSSTGTSLPAGEAICWFCAGSGAVIGPEKERAISVLQLCEEPGCLRGQACASPRSQATSFRTKLATASALVAHVCVETAPAKATCAARQRRGSRSHPTGDE